MRLYTLFLINFLFFSLPNLQAQNVTGSKPLLIRNGNQFTARGPFGGKIIEIINYPENPSLLYAVVDNSISPSRPKKLYKTTNSGETWEFCSWMEGTQLFIDPRNPVNIFATNYFQTIIKSTNGFQ